jgi:hypothetical protein
VLADYIGPHKILWATDYTQRLIVGRNDADQAGLRSDCPPDRILPSLREVAHQSCELWLRTGWRWSCGDLCAVLFGLSVSTEAQRQRRHSLALPWDRKKGGKRRARGVIVLLTVAGIEANGRRIHLRLTEMRKKGEQ